jgi:hypothetical protein
MIELARHRYSKRKETTLLTKESNFYMVYVTGAKKYKCRITKNEAQEFYEICQKKYQSFQ